MILGENLLRSSAFLSGKYQFIFQRGYHNVPKAYNDAWDKAEADLLVFLHQDVFLPDEWVENLIHSIKILDKESWGVLGVAGVTLAGDVQEYFGHIRQNEWEWEGNLGRLPARVDTLDELLLIAKRELSLRFDEKIPMAHFYGADLCLQASSCGFLCFAIEAYCHHNTIGSANSNSFRLAEDYMRKKWKDRLPFATTCVIVKKGLLKHKIHQMLIDFLRRRSDFRP